ncbi:MAG: response regulator [Planctomycetota bacterium]|nr:response regulator [Planctomycetota bacterium]MDA1247852.1 response regulator [Planctomycetota bacterium]
MRKTKPYHLLVADDDARFRSVLRSLLEPWFELFEASSGERAVEIVEDRRIDLLLLDMHMEELTGIETVEIVKRINSRLPCILVTGDATDEVVEKATKADIWSVLSKPVRRVDLMATVSAAIDNFYDDPDVFSGFSTN